MRKFYFTVLYLLVTQLGYSQMNGSYTVGAAPSDYTRITDAVADLSQYGISGPVVFNLKDGYHSAQNINIGPVSGSSAVNTVTFQSESLNSQNVTINGNTIFTLQYGAQHFIFKHLGFNTSATGSRSRLAFDIFGNTTSDITISNCKFTGGSSSLTTEYFNSSTNNKHRHSFIRLGEVSNIEIKENTFSSIGAVIFKTVAGNADNVTISDNNFSGVTITPIHITKVNNLVFHNNTYTGNVKYRTFEATLLSGTTTISNNKLFTLNNDYGFPGICMYLSSSSATGGNLIVKNNFISQLTGMGASNFTTVSILNNSFHSLKNECISISGSGNLENFSVHNNIFSTDFESPNITVYNSLDFSKYTSSNNAFSKEKDVIFYCNNNRGGNYYDLADWKTFSGKDLNSQVVGYVYQSEMDFHTPNSYLLNGAGIPLTEVSEDIDGDPRDVTNPDIGADEFIMDFNTYMDLEISEVVSPTSTPCDPSGIVLSVKNNGVTAVTQMDIEAAINDFRENVATYNVNIPSGETVLVPVTHCQLLHNTHYDKIEFFVSRPNGLLDNNYSNNHKRLLNVFQLGDFSILTETNECIDETILFVPIMDNTTVLWSTGETTPSITVAQTGTFSATLTSPQGCQVTNSITLD